MSDMFEKPRPEAYVLSLLAEGKYEVAFEVIGEVGFGHLYAPDYSNYAHQMMECGKDKLAVDLFRKAMTLDPGLAQAPSGLGILYLRQGKHGLAIEALQQAVNLNPESACAQTALGIALCNSGKAIEAIPHLTRALECMPGLASAEDALRKVRKALAQQGKGRGRKKRGPVPTLSSARKKELFARIDTALQHSAETRQEETPPPTLSVCMIVRDEEETLARCLRSVQKAADEIVVVDTGSKDRTVEIAREFDAKIGHFEWCDDFAAARNYALGLTSCDWILTMDADDEMDPGGDAGLRLFINGRPEAEACWMRTRIPCPGGFETFIEHPRLFRNHIGLHYVNSVHEQLAYPDGRRVAPQISTSITVYHHGYIATPEEVNGRHERNLRILQAEIERKPDDALTHFFLAKEYRSPGNFEKALPHLRRALELLAEQNGSFLRLKTFSYLGETLVALGRPEEAERIYEEAFEYFPDNPGLWFGMGEARLALGRAEEAVHAYETATRGRFGDKLANQDFMCRDLKPRLRLAEIALARGDVDEAEAQWKKAHAVRGDMELLHKLRARIDNARAEQPSTQDMEQRIADCRRRLGAQPDDLGARAALVSALIATGRAVEAEREAAEAVRHRGDCAEARNLHGTALTCCRRFEEAAEAFACAARSDPANSAVLCNLADTYHELGRTTEARDTFHAALAADKQCVVAHIGLGQLSFSEGKWEEALESFENALKIEPEHVEAWLGVARTYLEKRALQATITAYEKAVNLSGGTREVMAELASVRHRLVEMAQSAGKDEQCQPVSVNS
ncbi:MAG: tetratricopeptide repeat protein [Armatimonadetes bacterium]|nr:tetratricopeptide repeat protein [Armatimonadota bacterium]NIM23129.1 tetratricopeptide repeat protein [Armatimonadota bacterium]NIM66997.1 tetratricopeptide repeat protein [Armatimonadota bacterium]NIM75531.1 tetratricopeptide repeat protein [Armatimonadota bacterium]NIN05186.1 tetratricopeptide repeat protein [Armatimonadota bacterium]